jgi:hypothetical protein
MLGLIDEFDVTNHNDDLSGVFYVTLCLVMSGTSNFHSNFPRSLASSTSSKLKYTQGSEPTRSYVSSQAIRARRLPDRL